RIESSGPVAITVASMFLSAGMSTPVIGQTSAQTQGDTRTLAPITVQAAPGEESPLAPVNGYIAKRSITATKTDTPLNETPQSITLLASDQIRDHGAQGLQDALTYAAGVRSDAYGLDSR